MFGFNKYLLACYTILFLNIINFGYETLIIIGILILLAKLKENVAPLVNNLILEYITNIAINFINTLNNKLNNFSRTTKNTENKLLNYTSNYSMLKNKSMNLNALFINTAKKQVKTKISSTKNNLNKTL